MDPDWDHGNNHRFRSSDLAGMAVNVALLVFCVAAGVYCWWNW